MVVLGESLAVQRVVALQSGEGLHGRREIGKAEATRLPNGFGTERRQPERRVWLLYRQRREDNGLGAFRNDRPAGPGVENEA